MTDLRIVYGATCAWWDSINNVGRTAGGLPGCPHCGGVLFEIESERDWWSQVDEHEHAGNPGYRAFIEWLRGRCLPDFNAAREAYDTRQEVGDG